MKIKKIDEKGKGRYKVILSINDWEKIFLEINHKIPAKIILFITALTIFLAILFTYLIPGVNNLFHFSPFIIFFVTTSIFMGLPTLFLYFMPIRGVFEPFKLNGMEVDVIEKKILFKNKIVSLKNTHSLVFYLEKNQEKNKNLPQNKMNIGKFVTSYWIYYVKRKAIPESNVKDPTKVGFLENNSNELVFGPVEINDIVDFNIILGGEGVLGIWKQIAELLSVDFEENIEWEEKKPFQPIENSFSYKTSSSSRLNGKSLSFNKAEEDYSEMKNVPILIRQKIEEKGVNLVSEDSGELILFEDELMGVKVSSSGFELRFWENHSFFPTKKQDANEDFADSDFVVRIGLYISLFFLISFIYDLKEFSDLKKICFYIPLVLLGISWIAFEYKGKMASMHSNSLLLRGTYVLFYFSFFTAGIIMVFISSLENNLALKFVWLLLGISIFIIILLIVLNELHYFYCPWNQNINRYLSKLVFSFEDNTLEGEYGFCVLKYHWKTPIHKVQSLGLLRGANSFFRTCLFFLVIKVEEDYIVMPFPCLEEDERREVLSFLNQAFNSLL